MIHFNSIERTQLSIEEKLDLILQNQEDSEFNSSYSEILDDIRDEVRQLATDFSDLKSDIENLYDKIWEINEKLDSKSEDDDNSY